MYCCPWKMTKFQQGVRRLRRRAKLIPRASKAKENKEMKSCEKVLFLFVSAEEKAPDTEFGHLDQF